MRPSGHLWEANNDCSKKHFVSFPHAHHCKISDFLHALKQHPPSLEKRLKEAHINSPFCSDVRYNQIKIFFLKKKHSVLNDDNSHNISYDEINLRDRLRDHGFLMISGKI